MQADDQTKSALTGKLQEIQSDLGKLATDSDVHQTLFDMGETQKQVELVGNQLYNSLLQNYQDINATAASDPDFINALQQWSNAFTSMALNKLSLPNARGYWQANLLTQLNAAWANAMGNKTQTENDIRGLTWMEQPVAWPNLMINSSSVNPDYYLKDQGVGEMIIQRSIAIAQNRYYLFNILQTFILAILIGLAALNTLGPTFTGTWTQLTTLFIISFSMDITVSSLTSMKTVTL